VGGFPFWEKGNMELGVGMMPLKADVTCGLGVCGPAQVDGVFKLQAFRHSFQTTARMNASVHEREVVS
jgi:hypothetical protein